MRDIRALLLGIGIPLLGGLGYIIYLLIGLTAELPPLPSEKASSTPSTPKIMDPIFLRGNCNVQEGKLVRKVAPDYPALARQMRWRPPLLIIQATVG